MSGDLVRYDKDDTLDRAKKLIQSNSPEALKYACLELRMCIEMICYEKFQLYLEEIPQHSLKTWQPRKVMKVLHEIDPLVEFDCTVVIGQESKNGRPNWESYVVSDHKAITFNFVKETYDKLGSYLHVPVMSDQRLKHLESIENELRNYLLDKVVPEIERLCSSECSVNITERYPFQCAFCHNEFTMSKRSLETFKTAVCPVDSCKAEYDFSYKGGRPTLNVKMVVYKCDNCCSPIFIYQHKLKEDVEISCEKCSSKFIVKKHQWAVVRAR